MSDDIASTGLLQRFEVVAYGCHERARKRIRRELQDPRISIETFLFVEYFCLEPLVISKPDDWSTSHVYFPFIRRIIEDNQFLWCPDSSGALLLQPKSPSVVKTFSQQSHFVMPGPLTSVGTQCFQKWRQQDFADSQNTTSLVPFKQRISPGDWDEILQRIKWQASTTHQRTLLLEFSLIGAPWQQSKHPCILYAFPIASGAIFYGYFILIVPDPSSEACSENSRERALESCIDRLFPNINEDIYMPVLMLLHESLLEEELRNRIDDAVRVDAERDSQGSVNKADRQVQEIRSFITDTKIPFLHKLHGRVASANRAGVHSTMENELRALWNRRLELAADLSIPGAGNEKIRETLLFARYHVASPGMVETVRKVMLGARQLRPPRNSGDPLPAALVYGSPGSGKDTLARMLPLFSSDYFADDIHTVNMSALKPDFLTGPLLQGLSIASAQNPQQDAKASGFSLDGIFYAATESHSRQEQTRERRKATFILDELNSLDIDLQGILLRILEQGEVTPLLGLARQHIRHLIVGIVNEDPEDISRETEIRNLLVDKGRFGSLLSGLLYEVVRRSRRLRNDLYHRISRQLYVPVPDIDARREDIPILFYHTIIKEPGWENAIIDLHAYRLIMDSRISWPGNIRTIQSVAKRAVLCAQSMDIDHISYQCVREALEAEFRDLAGKLDDAG